MIIEAGIAIDTEDVEGIEIAIVEAMAEEEAVVIEGITTTILIGMEKTKRGARLRQSS